MSLLHRASGSSLFKHFNILQLTSRLTTMATGGHISTTIETLKFNNLALRTLPIDPINDNHTREVKNACFSLVKPTPLKSPSMVVYSKSAMALLDLDEQQMNRKEAAEYFCGNRSIPGSQTASHCYCGHQFGVFAGQLGDGAAMYLGEVINERGERWEIQFKGAGLTPYSRTADGRKVLRSSLREFLCSEAMHFLGVATTRAGTCIVSEDKVVRDIFYDGHPRLEKCSVILRIAPTFFRFGSFEIFLPVDRQTGGRGPSYGNNELLIKMLDYVSNTFFGNLVSSGDGDSEKLSDKVAKYEKVFEEVVRRTARLVAGWQCVGFVHGVLNTDNMSILGLTIDYGPFGLLDRFDPDHIFNGSDHGGRYTYRAQPGICEWNCIKLAEAISPVVPLAKTKKLIKDIFKVEYKASYMELMRKKLGLFTKKDNDEQLIAEFMDAMYETRADMTNSFRKLSQLNRNGATHIDDDIDAYLPIIAQQCCPLNELRMLVKPQFPIETLNKLVEALQVNPAMVLAFVSEDVIKKDVANHGKSEKLKNLTEEEHTINIKQVWATWLKKYLERCYSEDDVNEENRVVLMNSNNPRFILRNHLAQSAIEKAEVGKFTEACVLLRLLENPFSDEPVTEILAGLDIDNDIRDLMDANFFEMTPPLNKCVNLTCSS